MRLVNYHTTHGHRVAIVDEPGRKWLRVVFFDPSLLAVEKVALEEQRFMRDIPHVKGARHAPVVSVARRWLREVSATSGAKEVLQRAGKEA